LAGARCTADTLSRLCLLSPEEAKDALLVLELAPQSVSTFLHSDAAPARAQIVTLVRDDLLA